MIPHGTSEDFCRMVQYHRRFEPLMKRPCKCIESSVRSGEDIIMNFNTTGARRIHCLTGYTG